MGSPGESTNLPLFEQPLYLEYLHCIVMCHYSQECKGRHLPFHACALCAHIPWLCKVRPEFFSLVLNPPLPKICILFRKLKKKHMKNVLNMNIQALQYKRKVKTMT